VCDIHVHIIRLEYHKVKGNMQFHSQYACLHN
jgi:hypothetical protein